MKKNLPVLAIIAFTALILIGLFILAAQQPSTTSSSTSTSIGANEINFSLPDTTGKKFTLADTKGKSVVFLEFFAVWCPHCQREAPLVDDLYNKYQGKGVTFVDVQASQYGKNYESGDNTPATIADLQWFKSNFNVPFPILLDQSTATATKYGVQGFPTIFIIDKKGKIYYTSSGEVAESQLASELEGALKK